MRWTVRQAGRFGLALLFGLVGAAAVAEAPDVSLRPEVRVIVPPGRPLVRPGRDESAEAGAVTDVAPDAVAAQDETVAVELAAPVEDTADVPPEPIAELAERPIEAEPAADRLPPPPPDAHEVTAAEPAPRWTPDPPARPDLRLVPRPEVQLATGTPPGRPVSRPPLPPRPFFFDEIWIPRIYGAAAWSPRPEISELAVAEAVLPPERPAEITRAAEAARVARQRGAVCGNPAIQGDTLGSVPGPGACGIDGAVRVRSVAGVPLSTTARMDCTTARALLRWVENGAIPAVGGTGGGLREIRVIGEYSCRSRNNVPGARLSEHSFGRAIDISGFTLANGTRVSLLRHWRSGTYGRMLLNMHRSACGIFGTVLGPNANAAHRDHFHFDTARYRSGSYCR